VDVVRKLLDLLATDAPARRSQILAEPSGPTP
jgi:hypothetical protein